MSQSLTFTQFIITFIKRSVSWLNKCKIADVQLIIEFTQATFKYTAIRNKTMFSKADNYMNEGFFQSVSS